MKSFSQFINENKSHAVVVWGRLNPPTIGHLKLLDKGAEVARNADYHVYVSQSQDKKKNPLSYADKVKWIRKMFPRHARNVMLDKNVKTIFDLLTKMYDKGYRQVTLIAGSDRVPEYEKLVNRYNGEKARHGFYEFDGGVKVVSAGERDPDAEGAAGMSASKMRAAVTANDFQTFKKGLPDNFDEGLELFNHLRKEMGYEITPMREHLKLKTVSQIREDFVEGKILNEGDVVYIKESGELCSVVLRGSNYLIVEKNEDKSKLRVWLTDVSVI